MAQYQINKKDCKLRKRPVVLFVGSTSTILKVALYCYSHCVSIYKKEQTQQGMLNLIRTRYSIRLEKYIQKELLCYVARISTQTQSKPTAVDSALTNLKKTVQSKNTFFTNILHFKDVP